MTGCGGGSGSDSSDSSSSGESTKFTVGFDAEYPPYGYMDDNGEYTGFDLELAQEVCKLAAWTPTVLSFRSAVLEMPESFAVTTT